LLAAASGWETDTIDRRFSTLTTITLTNYLQVVNRKKDFIDVGFCD